ncbi:hypothetical protein [Ruegeria arenilitoris]|uniref:hypothetical protein n=1 Tax=Ruegeria arenilitoris TaxID=1173585 RepID=UPI00147D487A|nr:hypothetical protein [Ruegeria arenilitoris]
MAHYKRKRPRTVPGNGYSRLGLSRRLGKDPDDVRWLGNWPRGHDIIFHTRPTRRKSKALALGILKGADPDGISWPDSRKQASSLSDLQISSDFPKGKSEQTKLPAGAKNVGGVLVDDAKVKFN